MEGSPFSITVPEAVAQVRARNGSLNAYISTRLDAALADAEQRASEPPQSLLHNVPFGLKDEWETLALPTTGGSYRHRDRQSPNDSVAFEAFNQAGAVLIGKTNLSDLGLAPEATNHVIGPTLNPWDSARTAGGSSGGAAAAVAVGMQGFDWGTDIGGSIRQPAAFCGILGMRLASETWPLHDSFPVIPRPVSWMCGQGPLTRTTDQMRAVLKVAATRLRTGPSRPFEVRGAMLYAPESLGQWPGFVADVTPHVETAFDTAVRKDHGLPKATRIRNIYSAVWASHLEDLVEADATLSLGSALRASLGALLWGPQRGDRRIHPHSAKLLALMALGRITIFHSRKRALQGADRVRDQFRALWDKGYVVVAPATTLPASLHGNGNHDHAEVLFCTAPGNLADATGLSIPFGRFGTMPRALQLMGPPGSETALLEVADRLISSRDADPSLTPRPWP
ncbi:MAG: amidase [Deltaproteobacteria bacterium]|nr:amidase [Deltaproteobacteria bacterium]